MYELGQDCFISLVPVYQSMVICTMRNDRKWRVKS